MNIEVTKPAIQWFKDEFDLNKEHPYIRIFARYGGCGSLQSGFSLGISAERPNKIGAKTEVDGIIFYIEEQDLWYFDNHHLKVKYSRKHQEIEFVYEQSN
ncbi:HesB/YadR/YfhF family protein [Bacillus sp. JCM 19034]|uniref:HesB/YadR/YfhF family protein n=1 Tax=Bacillus sp. JCM 19034 TaxID=1481928 RepID=UPI000782A57C|nr:HesB/YadR/YfhF family protein [Bacillus sp. JCM 19034]